MAFNCPECDQIVSSQSTSCKHCGADLGDFAPPPPPKSNDAAKYGILAGVAIAIVILLLVLGSSMGSDMKCKDCSGKGYKICEVCKDKTPAPCTNCDRTGRDKQTFSTCPTCGGKGELAKCPRCNGNARKICPTCKGDKKVAN